VLGPFFASSVKHYSFSGFKTVTGALSALSQHCNVGHLFGSSGFRDEDLNSLCPTELGMPGQCKPEDPTGPGSSQIQGTGDGPSSRSLNPGKLPRMHAHLPHLLERPLGKAPGCYAGGVYMTLNTALLGVAARYS